MDYVLPRAPQCVMLTAERPGQASSRSPSPSEKGGPSPSPTHSRRSSPDRHLSGKEQELKPGFSSRPTATSRTTPTRQNEPHVVARDNMVSRATNVSRGSGRTVSEGKRTASPGPEPPGPGNSTWTPSVAERNAMGHPHSAEARRRRGSPGRSRGSSGSAEEDAVDFGARGLRAAS